MIRKSTIFLLLLFAVCISFLFCVRLNSEELPSLQKITFYGRISDYAKIRNKSLPPAQVFMFKDGVLMDSSEVMENGSYEPGNFKFDSVAEGTYDFVVRGNNYFPIKVTDFNVIKKSYLNIYKESPFKVISCNSDINDSLIFVHLKPSASGVEFEKRLQKLYKYKIKILKSESMGDIKFFPVKLKDDKELVGCAIQVPKKETPIGVSNKLIMDSAVYRIEQIFFSLIGTRKANLFSSICGHIPYWAALGQNYLMNVKAFLFKDTLVIDSTDVWANGEFRFDSLCQGSYDVVIRGSDYFPIKFAGLKIKEGIYLNLYPAQKLDKIEGSLEFDNRKVIVSVKPRISEFEFEHRILKSYGYTIRVIDLIKEKIKFFSFDNRRDIHLRSCEVLVPQGETPTSVANKLIMSPFVYSVTAAGVVKVNGKVIEKRDTKKLK